MIRIPCDVPCARAVGQTDCRQEAIIVLGEIVTAIVRGLFLLHLALDADVLAMWREIERVANLFGIGFSFEECDECRIQASVGSNMLQRHAWARASEHGCRI